MSILPVGPTWTTARFGTTVPLVQFWSEASGWAATSGHAVRKLGAVVLVTVIFATTAVGGFGSVISGTPPTPATVSARPVFGPHGSENLPMPLRLSRMRTGAIGEKRLPVPVALVSVIQPFTSTMSWTVPCRL